MNREDLKGEGERVREVFACNRIKRVFVAPSLSFFPLVLFGLVGVATHRERSIRDAIELNEPIYFPVYTFTSYTLKVYSSRMISY